MEPFIDFFVVFVTNISSIHVICWSLFVLVNQCKMSKFIKGKFDTDTKIMKVIGLNMKPTLDLMNVRNITNTMSLKGF